MDIEKLIERLYKHHTDWGEGRTQDFFEVCLDCKDAATAISTIPALQAKLEKVFPGCEKCRNQANWPSWIEKGFVYCPKCGTPLTSWAWEKQVERLEVLKDAKR